MKLPVLVAYLIPLAVLAQSGASTGFPPTSTTPTAQELGAHLSGKSFHAKYADGTPVRSKFGTDGGLSATAPSFYDTGHWRTEDGKLCGSLRKMGEFCNEARFDAGVLYLRRMNGEVVRYDAD